MINFKSNVALETLLQQLQEFSNEVYSQLMGNTFIECIYGSFDKIPHWALDGYNRIHYMTEYAYNRGLQVYNENPDEFFQSIQFSNIVSLTRRFKRYLNELNESEQHTPLINNLHKYTVEKFSELPIQHTFKPQKPTDTNPNIFYYHYNKPSYVCFWNNKKDERNEQLALHDITFQTAADILIDISKYKVSRMWEIYDTIQKRIIKKDRGMPPRLKVNEQLRWKVECLYTYDKSNTYQNYNGCILVYRMMSYNGYPVIHIISAMEIPSKRLYELIKQDTQPIKSSTSKVKPKPNRILKKFTSNEVKLVQSDLSYNESY